MLSTLILLPPAPGTAPVALGALVRTLVALVPATVEGLIRDVAVVAPDADESVRRVTDHAGCALIDAGTFASAFAHGVSDARCQRLFILRAGAAFERGFVDEVSMLLGPDREETSAVWLLRETRTGMLSRLMPDRAPVAGVIAHRDSLGGPVKDFADLVRRLGRARTVASRASMAS